MGSVFDNGGYIGRTQKYATKYVETTGFSFVASATGVNARTVVIPVSAQAGDIAVISDNVDNSGTFAAPSGWTLIKADAPGGNIALVSYYKVLVSGDVGSTVTSVNTSTTDHFMLCTVYRPNNDSSISTVIINDLDGQATTGDPDADTVTMSTGTPPLIGFIVFAQRGSNNVGLNVVTAPASDGSATTQDEAARNVLRHYYKFYNTGQTTADMTGDIGDSGAQAIQSWYFTFGLTTLFGVKTYNPGIHSLSSARRDTIHTL